MKRIHYHVTTLAVLCVLAGVGFFLVAASMVEDSLTHVPQFVVSYAAPPEVSAEAVLILDRETGSVVYEKRADEVLPIASVTKLFSSALFWKRTAPLATTTISWSDVAEEGRSGRLAGGQSYQNRELLFPVLLESSNDAARTMERTAPVPLVEMMNDFADEHGALETSFADASGLSDRNVSTARELALLFEAVSEEHPHIIDVTTLPTYLNHVNAWMNNNPFINELGYKGGKHGYTEAANRTVIAQFEESVSGMNREILYVLLGSDDLKSDMAILRSFVASATSLE